MLRLEEEDDVVVFRVLAAVDVVVVVFAGVLIPLSHPVFWLFLYFSAAVFSSNVRTTRVTLQS